MAAPLPGLGGASLERSMSDTAFLDAIDFDFGADNGDAPMELWPEVHQEPVRKSLAPGLCGKLCKLQCRV